MSKWIRRGTLPAVCVVAMATAGCGDYVRQGKGPSQATVAILAAAPGAEPDKFGGTLLSDVITLAAWNSAGRKLLLQSAGPTTIFGLGRSTT